MVGTTQKNSPTLNEVVTPTEPLTSTTVYLSNTFGRRRDHAPRGAYKDPPSSKLKSLYGPKFRVGIVNGRLTLTRSVFEETWSQMSGHFTPQSCIIRKWFVM